MACLNGASFPFIAGELRMPISGSSASDEWVWEFAAAVSFLGLANSEGKLSSIFLANWTASWEDSRDSKTIATPHHEVFIHDHLVFNRTFWKKHLFFYRFRILLLFSKVSDTGTVKSSVGLIFGPIFGSSFGVLQMHYEPLVAVFLCWNFVNGILVERCLGKPVRY